MSLIELLCVGGLFGNYLPSFASVLFALSPARSRARSRARSLKPTEQQEADVSSIRDESGVALVNLKFPPAYYLRMEQGHGCLFEMSKKEIAATELVFQHKYENAMGAWATSDPVADDETSVLRKKFSQISRRRRAKHNYTVKIDELNLFVSCEGGPVRPGSAAKIAEFSITVSVNINVDRIIYENKGLVGKYKKTVLVPLDEYHTMSDLIKDAFEGEDGIFSRFDNYHYDPGQSFLKTFGAKHGENLWANVRVPKRGIQVVYRDFNFGECNVQDVSLLEERFEFSLMQFSKGLPYANSSIFQKFEVVQNKSRGRKYTLQANRILLNAGCDRKAKKIRVKSLDVEVEVIYVADFPFNRPIRNGKHHKVSVIRVFDWSQPKTFQKMLEEAFDGKSGIFEKMRT